MKKNSAIRGNFVGAVVAGAAAWVVMFTGYVLAHDMVKKDTTTSVITEIVSGLCVPVRNLLNLDLDVAEVIAGPINYIICTVMWLWVLMGDYNVRWVIKSKIFIVQ